MESVSRSVIVASCTLNQWSMDFEGNKKRIIESILMAKEKGAKIRCGPELEIPGYGCEDHFLELDTIYHCWAVIADILNSDLTDGILCDLGMPVDFNSVIYNCRVILYQRRVVCIRPKMDMADDGGYRESRWFTGWQKGYIFEDYILPGQVSKLYGQNKTKIGIGIVRFKDLTYATEICEELWAPFSPSVDFTKWGVDIISNSSGSYFQIQKNERRFELVVNSSKKNGGVFIYTNLVGCDGGRNYYDGGSFVCINGNILAEGQRFMLEEVEVMTACVDLNQVTNFRTGIRSRCVQSSKGGNNLPVIDIDDNLCLKFDRDYKIILTYDPFMHKKNRHYTFETEMQWAPACWLWDYLRRSGASGFFLPLSGGADSSSVAIIISLLTRMIYQAIHDKENVGVSKFILSELRRIVKDDTYVPKSPQEIASKIFVTCYMGTKNNTKASEQNAINLSKEIGNLHYTINIDKIVEAFVDNFTENFGKEPKFKAFGGTNIEQLALSNIQARTRMVVSYIIAQLSCWSRDKPGFLLVVGSSNLDEGLTGYLTKYDCSSADINPIGSISKIRLHKFLTHCLENLGYESIRGVLEMKPTAELVPSTETYTQTDEDEMGITFEELGLMGRLRKELKCGPFTMFKKLSALWKDKTTDYILAKTRLFFWKYSANRHKMTVITPSLHCEDYSIDDNRFDLRQFLYNNNWTFQFKEIDKFVKDNPNIIRY